MALGLRSSIPPVCGAQTEKKQISKQEPKHSVLQEKTIPMNRIFIFLIHILLTTPFMALSQNLEIPGPYQWKNRILLVFSPEENSGMKEQVAIFKEHQKGLEERDLVIFMVEEAAVKNPDGSRYGKEAADKLRQKYQIPEDQFSVILIGKDGTEKLRQKEVLDTEKLYSIIDSMPMRRREMRQRD